MFVRTVYADVRTVFARFTMERSGRSITNVEGQTERPAWADAYLAELNESIRAIVQPTHSLCMELQCRLTGLETKLALTDRAITEELNIMRMEIIRIREQLSQLSSLSIPFRFFFTNLDEISLFRGSNHIQLANFLEYERDLTAFPNLPMSEEGRPTKAEVFRTMLGDDTTILEGSFMVHGQLLPFWRIMHLILCSSIDPKKHTTELSYSRAEFLYLAVVRGLPVDIASYIYLSIRAEALKTDATISLPHGILLTQFLHAMMEQPEEAMEGEDPGQSSTQGLGAQRPSWMDDMMTELSQRMESVLQPTHCMVSDISRRLTALEQKVADMDVGWKKEITALKEVLKGVATGAELFPLTERVVLIEEHLRHMCLNFDANLLLSFGYTFSIELVHLPSMDDFQLDYDRAEDRFTVTSTMNIAYRTHRNKIIQHYSVFNSKEEALEHPYPEMNKEEWTRVCDLFASEEFQRRSAINKENRAKLKIVHTSGARSFQRTRAFCSPPLAESARTTHKKNFLPVPDRAAPLTGSNNVRCDLLHGLTSSPGRTKQFQIDRQMKKIGDVSAFCIMTNERSRATGFAFF
ncbi:hypothetical protein CJ030_MR8G026779 [Morella rubra]|uniref:Uncharacterized protein n=1 Tax=Morella rubra TaxID=262757 RepID=A0A6A1USS8_9ROSI|nr:hypothetical protein CJ030_MR8G026779 [Morella rubra]